MTTPVAGRTKDDTPGQVIKNEATILPPLSGRDACSSSNHLDALMPAAKRAKHTMVGEGLPLTGLETTVEGQLQLNPHFTQDQARVAAQKEYNRRNSARSRVRNKKQMVELHERLSKLTKREQELMRENQALRLEVSLYRRELEDSAKLQQTTVRTFHALQQQQQQQHSTTSLVNRFVGPALPPRNPPALQKSILDELRELAGRQNDTDNELLRLLRNHRGC